MTRAEAKAAELADVLEMQRLRPEIAVLDGPEHIEAARNTPARRTAATPGPKAKPRRGR